MLATGASAIPATTCLPQQMQQLDGVHSPDTSVDEKVVRIEMRFSI
jgi:hypothetical protein